MAIRTQRPNGTVHRIRSLLLYVVTFNYRFDRQQLSREDGRVEAQSTNGIRFCVKFNIFKYL